MKIEIDLTRYPNIKQLVDIGKPGKAQVLLKDTFTMVNDHITDIPELLRIIERHQEIKNTYGLGFNAFLHQVQEVFLDHTSITEHHPDPAEGEVLASLKEENNPLYFITNPPKDENGKPILPENMEWVEGYNLKDFIHGLFYWSRYTDLASLARALYLGDFDLLNNLKMQNVQELLQIQPALKYQEANNILIGKLIQGTGYFDCGTTKEIINYCCPACHSVELSEGEKDTSCLNCKAGFRKEI